MSKKNHLRVVGGDKDIKEPMTVESAFALVEHIIQFHLRIYDGHPNKGEGYEPFERDKKAWEMIKLANTYILDNHKYKKYLEFWEQELKI